MARVTIYGASDDLIEIEGAINEELSAMHDGGDDDEGALLTFSDGTVLRVRYTVRGFWRITPEARGTAQYDKHEGTDPEDDYSDRVTLTGDIAWVVYAHQITRASKATAEARP